MEIRCQPCTQDCESLYRSWGNPEGEQLPLVPVVGDFKGLVCIMAFSTSNTFITLSPSILMLVKWEQEFPLQGG